MAIFAASSTRRTYVGKEATYASIGNFGSRRRGLARRLPGSSWEPTDGRLRPFEQWQEHDGRPHGPRPVRQGRGRRRRGDAARGRARCGRWRRTLSPTTRARCTESRTAHGGSTGRSRAVDHQTTRRLVGNLPPSVLAPLCAVSFRESPNIGQLLSKEFALGFQAIQSNHEDGGPQASRRAAELAARRDLLAQELETRIAGERRASGDLESRWRNSIGRPRTATVSWRRWSSGCNRAKNR